MIIALDGPAASGKGTLSKKLASEFGLPYLDTGLLYRAVGYQALQQNIQADALYDLEKIAMKIELEAIDQTELRSSEVAQMASKIASIPQVREALIKAQRNFANQAKGAILDGRDIGTVIAPHADYKFYITASAEVRAERRHKDLVKSNENISFDDVLKDIKERDARDQNRKTAPAKQAEDAHLIDTTNLCIEEAYSAVMSIINET